MLAHLIRKELLDHISSLRFLILSAIGTLVIWLSLYSGYLYYQNSLKDYRLAQAATANRIREIDAAENYSEFVAQGYLEHKPPAVMGIFIRGLDPVLGRSIPNTFNRRSVRSWMEVKPLLAVFPPLDLGLVIQAVLSLFVLLFTYDAVCGEKEAGTLRLNTSFSVPRHRLLLGKVFGVLLPTLSAFGLPLLLGIAVILVMPDVRFTGSELQRLGLVMAAFGVYLTVFVCAGLLASCMTQRASTSFVILLGFWVTTVVVLPRLSLIVADSVRPASSIHELEADKEAITKANVQRWREARRAWSDAYLKSKGEEWWQSREGQELQRLHYRKTRQEALFEITQVAYERLEEAFRNRYQARLNLAVALARFSPAFAFNSATVRLAGTGMDRQARFLSVYDQYYAQHRTWYVDAVDGSHLKRINPDKYGEYTWDLSDMPRFTYRERWPEGEVQAAMVDVGILAIWGVLFFVGAYVKMLRYDVR